MVVTIVMPDLRDFEDGRYRRVVHIGQLNHQEQDKHCKNKGNHEHQDYADCR